MEEKYIPTLPQKLFRVILGTVLVPLFGDMCILIWLFSTVDNAIPEKDFHGLLIISYIVATIFTAIPTFIMRLFLEFTTQKIKWRLLFSFIFALFLGVYLSKRFAYSIWVWIPSSLIAVLITEWILYKHIQYCVKK